MSRLIARHGPELQRTTDSSNPPILDIASLNVEFRREGEWVKVVDGVSLRVKEGEVLGILGESGAGKSVTGMSILQLLPPHISRVTGSIRFRGRELVGLREKELRSIRGNEIGMIFQEPMSSLNPAFTIGDQIAEVVRQHRPVSRREAWTRAVELLDLVEIPLPAQRANDYPHSFSGGMRQRAMLAMALSCEPDLLIADEPTTALDVTVQARIIELIADLQRRLGLTVILITHDFGVAGEICERIVVMYAGQVVERGPIDELFEHPLHPYTEGLLNSVPDVGRPTDRLGAIPGSVPPPESWPSGCRFHPRCSYSQEGRCNAAVPALADTDGRLVRCVRWNELNLKGAS